ncbi:MAG TPA: hypothetical protein VKZ50_14735 [bacterium]|nr:hypothetical protein [bacterium]
MGMKHNWHRSVVTGSTGVGLATLVGMLGLCAAVAAGATAPVSVAVVDFYAPTPLPVIGAVIPERAAADELATLLARGAAGGIAVVPQAAVGRAEASIHWRTQDALSFSRLADLAGALGVGRLVVGWIPLLSVAGNGNEPFEPDSNGMPIAQASVVVQVFDAGQGRIVAETSHSASAVGIMPAILVRDVLRNALAPTVPWLVTQLAPASMRGKPVRLRSGDRTAILAAGL